MAASRHVGSKRGAQDLVYRIRAVAVIEQYRRVYPAEARDLEWLFSPGDMRGETWKHSLLTEIGRAAKPQWIVVLAIRLCQIKPSTKQGVRLIRHWREVLRERDEAPASPQQPAPGADT